MTALRRQIDSNSTVELRREAFELIREKSFIRERVVLSSGQESDHYFDMKPSMMNSRGAEVLSALIFEKLPQERIDFFGGLEVGAIPIIGALASYCGRHGRPIDGIFVRKKPKAHGTKQLIEGARDLEGANLVVVDDVTTTGGSALSAINALKELGANILCVISLLDREEGAEELYAEAGIPFDPLFRASEFLKPR